MKKIRLTETQLSMLTEDKDIITSFKTTIADAIKAVNVQFSHLAFASVADIIDGDIDLNVIEQEMDRYEDIYHNQSKKLEKYFKHSFSDDDYYGKEPEMIHTKMDDFARKLNLKIDTIKLLISNLQDIVDMDAVKPFSDIETKKL